MNQSVLLFSWNSAQVSRDEIFLGGNEAPLLLGGGIRHKRFSVKNRVYRYTPVSPLPSSPELCEKVKCQNVIRICV